MIVKLAKGQAIKLKAIARKVEHSLCVGALLNLSLFFDFIFLPPSVLSFLLLRLLSSAMILFTAFLFVLFCSVLLIKLCVS